MKKLKKLKRRVEFLEAEVDLLMKELEPEITYYQKDNGTAVGFRQFDSGGNVFTPDPKKIYKG